MYETEKRLSLLREAWYDVMDSSIMIHMGKEESDFRKSRKDIWLKMKFYFSDC